jgi:6-phosphogluconolactonase
VAAPLSKFVYLANSFSNNISAYRIGQNGALKPLAGSPFPLDAGSMTVDFLGRFLYVAAGSTVSAYHIAENGALTPVAGSPFPGHRPVSMAVDFWGRFLYAANEFGGVSAYCIGESGALTSVAGSPFPTGRALPLP